MYYSNILKYEVMNIKNHSLLERISVEIPPTLTDLLKNRKTWTLS